MTGVETESTLKTEHCFPRLVNVMVGGNFMRRLTESEAQMTRVELDTGAIVAKRSVWADIREVFMNPSTKVGLRARFRTNSRTPAEAWSHGILSVYY